MDTDLKDLLIFHLLQYAKSISRWPLRIDYATGDRANGFTLEGYINASNFIEKSANGEKDIIKLQVITFEDDPNGLNEMQGIPEYFELIPCDDVAIAINLQRFNLINRINSPCRNDYPANLKTLLRSPLTAWHLNNAMLAPELL